ncbi:MAG: type II toxin-antitoxin system RelE/ParE family toxin [Motiliproteus sp.]
MKITWSPLAVEQARDIASYIALGKPSVAEQWVNGIFDSVDCLIDFPESGRIVPEIKRKEIREIVHGSYRVIYKIQDNQIWILLVKNYRQQLKEDEIQP